MLPNALLRSPSQIPIAPTNQMRPSCPSLAIRLDMTITTAECGEGSLPQGVSSNSMYGCTEMCICCSSHSPCCARPHTTTIIHFLSLPSIPGLIILYLPIAKRKPNADALPSRSVCRDTRYFSNASTAKNGWLFVNEQNTQSARAVSKRRFMRRGDCLISGMPWSRCCTYESRRFLMLLPWPA